MTNRKSAQPLRRQDHRIRRRELMLLLGGAITAAAELRPGMTRLRAVCEGWITYLERERGAFPGRNDRLKSGPLQRCKPKFSSLNILGYHETHHMVAEPAVPIIENIFACVGLDRWDPCGIKCKQMQDDHSRSEIWKRDQKE